MKRFLVAALALLCLLGAQCEPTPKPQPSPSPEPTPSPVPSPEPVPVPGPVPVPTVPSAAGDACDSAEFTAAMLGCPLKGSGSTSWADVCRNAAKNAVSMHQKCVSSATSCVQVTNCQKSTK